MNFSFHGKLINFFQSLICIVAQNHILNDDCASKYTRAHHEVGAELQSKKGIMNGNKHIYFSQFTKGLKQI